jgi:hypothetical protein
MGDGRESGVQGGRGKAAHKQRPGREAKETRIWCVLQSLPISQA